MSETPYSKVLAEVRKGGTVAADLMGILVGETLGEGAYRTVFVSEANTEQVVKFETDSYNFSNVHEWDLWENLKDHKVLKNWLAPCRHISQNGAILIQDRTRPVHKDHMPKKIPRIFADTKIQNWGMLDGRIVCHDYGNHHLYRGGNLAQLVNADWWG